MPAPDIAPDGDAAATVVDPAPAWTVALDGIVHRYGKTLALDGVGLTLAAGSATAVIGPDGVGKSTLLGLIAGVKRLQAGTVAVLGGDMADRRHRDAVAGHIAYMPQGLGRNLYPTLSVTENIAFHAALFGLTPAERDARVHRLLAATGLAPFADRPAGKLSGGMKQKLSLCCALVHDPDLLILDEPTTGVDPLSRRQFWELIADIRAGRPGMTVLVATAYMDEAERFDRIVAVADGRIIADGPTRDILAAAGASGLEDAYRRLQAGSGGAVPAPFAIAPRVQHDGPPAIAAEGLTRRFGDFTAVDHVSFRIERGEIFGFLGSNGCGKTTTMKMLTGLLPATEGTAELLGLPVDAGDLAVRMRVGYMSQGFSLYEELSVRGNLDFHAAVYHLHGAAARTRVAETIDRFGLGEVADAMPAALPLGIRQRLQLAAACLHKPEVLILDEPTSGVDPEARDSFWRHLGELSRRDGVTIFVSTHFMNEAERCDRISLMHAGRVLAVGAPAEIVAAAGTRTLEDAFIQVLERESGQDPKESGPAVKAVAPVATEQANGEGPTAERPLGRRDPTIARTLAFAMREARELLRDRVRLAFGLIGPMALLVVFAFGISFDVEKLTYAAFDRDQSIESRDLLRSLSGSRYFEERPPIVTEAEADRRLIDGELRLVVSIPPGFGRDLLQGRRPEIGFTVDGANTFRAETVRSYVQGVVLGYAAEKLAASPLGGAAAAEAVAFVPRFAYNQAFLSVNAITPGVIMLLLVLIPAMMTALGVVREKEIGSIANLRASPARVAEFLIGKQLPYAALGLVAGLAMVAIAVFAFGVPFRGSGLALAAGAALYVLATTGFGLLISTAVGTQVAAIFATAILSVVPAINFSGFLYPLSATDGAAWWVGTLFPSSWFQTIALGIFAKGLGPADLLPHYAALAGFGLVFVTAAVLLLDKQEH
ncbi:ribosome-associated ATPase/putative transporter RbbA [Prosthecodimorpha staleyi]|uniref:Ribosome-associated ATPase/putative transporter RbbA n=1 Tax=Prosthecodimorpha staleyi TaxID=2840188 RepID=A0A947D6I9_9HYPH|nr:ribosome-associated ATPase/putative transporter RbbA [Prosthecodimorpha staleyi]MBT9290486.1 ribosome-associated ATPase/putative transporter RbbA [Prosthecodimorpha staleyi]